MGSGISDSLAKFLELRGVSLAAVVGIDGLVIESAQREGVDVEAVAAIASNGLMLAEAMGRQLDRGSALQTLIEYEGGIVLIEPLGDEAMILVVSDDRNDLGRVRFVAKQQKPSLEQALVLF